MGVFLQLVGWVVAAVPLAVGALVLAGLAGVALDGDARLMGVEGLVPVALVLVPFALSIPGLVLVGAIVRRLDAGGPPPPAARGATDRRRPPEAIDMERLASTAGGEPPEELARRRREAEAEEAQRMYRTARRRS